MTKPIFIVYIPVYPGYAMLVMLHFAAVRDARVSQQLYKIM